VEHGLGLTTKAALLPAQGGTQQARRAAHRGSSVAAHACGLLPDAWRSLRLPAAGGWMGSGRWLLSLVAAGMRLHARRLHAPRLPCQRLALRLCLLLLLLLMLRLGELCSSL
jgi:hypothetical protein